MNAIMTIEAGKPSMSLDIPKGQTFDQWVEMGKRLAHSERVLGWYIGDWWEARKPSWGEGRAEQAAQNIWGYSYSTVRQYALACRRFAADRRLSNVSFEHHREVVQLPDDEVVGLLKRAVDENLSTRTFRIEAMKRKVALGLFRPRDEADDDPEHTELVDIARRWNRARKSVRQEFLDLANEAGLEEIDP